MDISVFDPFELPEWVGTHPVTWHATTAIGDGGRIAGMLTGLDSEQHELDVLAVDIAYPRLVCPDAERSAAHQAWQFGEVVLLDVDGRLAAAVPSNRLDVDLVCETLRRFARSVGADSSNVTVAITL